MIQFDLDTVVVFDLDDTLYKEDSYHQSGLKAVSALVSDLYGVDPFDMLYEWKNDGETDLWGKLCLTLNLPLSVKESFIWQYRLHSPDISLEESTKFVVDRLNSNTKEIVILTDGRSVTQRLKISVLGLSGLSVYISEEWESGKPCRKRFSEIMLKHPAGKYVYIGDNPQKDFKAPNELGWITIGLRGNGQNIHSQNTKGLSKEYLPLEWVDELKNICKFLC